MADGSAIRRRLHGAARWLHRWQNVIAGVLLAAAVLAGFRLWPHPALRDWKPSSTAVFDANGRLLRLTLAKDDRYRLWVPLERMSPQLVEAVMLHEDRWFWWHPGFNPYGLARGAWVTYVRGRNPQGGSTLTMQLARSLWRLNTRTPLGKLEQVGRALQLELFYSKRQILEAYLNDAPYGRNVEGAGTASVAYFDRQPDALTLPEALALAVIPQDPARRVRGGAGQDEINRALTVSRNRLYARWLERHPRDAALEPLFALPLAMRPLAALPFDAPHAVDQALAARAAWRNRGGDGDSDDARLVTTLDLGLQRALERQVGRYVARNDTHGIANAAAILVDTRDMGVKALVGSANFFDRAIQGQVNGTLARRSPGSTLKPFIYALGFDQGVLHPQTVLRDVPTSFGPYAPENFDGHFLGPITATDALNRSRNVPAVWVASQLGQPDLYRFLQDAGVRRLASAQHYGLALVLGGGEVTMQDLAGLYAMLANGGVFRPLRLRADEPVAPGRRLLSAEASFMTMDMLRQHLRPDETSGAQPVQLPVYWKTGTSWSFRDAWTAGVFGPYVLIVWVGNFDNSSNTAFVGVDAAAPLFFQIVDALGAERALAEPPRPAPPRVKRVRICLASGDLPNEWCPQQGWTWFIPGTSPIRVSTVHRPVVIDDATGRPACPPYDGKRTHTEIFEFWPSDLQQVFAKAGIPRRHPPQNPDCTNAGQADGDPPRITSPLRGSTYAMRVKDARDTRIAFNATADASAHALYWFVNDAYVGRSAPGDVLFWQPGTAGSFTVRVVDDHGRSDQRPLAVGLEQ
ncbi:penicillin-binding protein 1C [Burkholderia stagnalis]|uniref:penicillin-binding protein 1C n=1 Tax=Burkholderia stagnalis TaxID=1503054 RepID=UPI0007578A55|nr:penicillin-binding protein 1C [Burkholderia stagnalis]KWI41755.1 penicillin-binding protein 1C [Burkholderia stagnalis]KWI81418.1 penicillin-binding protein 1C [Burkholderia stagnalis]